jgi:anti-anti-sigma factor
MERGFHRPVTEAPGLEEEIMGDPIIRIERVKDHRGVGVAALGGHLDPRSMMAIQACLAFDRGRGFRDLILDMEQVRYLNSLGMSALINLSDQLGGQGGGLHLAGAQPKVKLILEMMGLTEKITLHGSISSALRSIRAEREASILAPKARQGPQNSALTR